MTKEKEKKKPERKTAPKKKKVLKVGGLWVDPTSFPSLDEKEDEPSRQ